MIHYSLVCAEGHSFDSWFRDSAVYERQAAQELISCPFCHSTKITRDVMAPNVARTHERATPARTTPAVALLDESQSELRAMIRQLRAAIVATTDDVGEKFPEEARKIEGGEVEPRAIRGRASFEEAKALLEDGIEIFPIPRPANDGN